MLQSRCLIWCIAALLGACQGNTIYTHIYKLDGGIWHRDKPANFNFTIQDTTQGYDIYILVTNTSDYPFQNLYVTYYLKNSQLEEIATELLDYLLFEPKTGKPLGKGWTKNKNHEVIVLKNYYFKAPGTYMLELVQFMRKEMLPGIQAIGIKICKSAHVASQ